ncbi:MAG: DUF6056 family protein [Candidatus Nanoperiomorbaceae bacterium]
MQSRIIKFFKKHQAKLSVLLLLIVTLPILYSFLFTRPQADDFSMSNLVHDKLVGQGIFPAIGQVFTGLVAQWHDWQFMYSNTLLQQAPTSIFGERYYFIGVLAIFLSLMLAVYFLAYSIAQYALKNKFGHAWVTVASFVNIFIALFSYSLREGVFWYSGACNYTIAVSAQIFLVGLLIKLWHKQYSDRRRYSLYIFAVSLVAFFSVGHNISPALGGGYICATFLALSVIKSIKDKVPAKKLIPAVIIFLVALGGLIFNMSAPGNTVRMRMDGFTSTPLPKAAVFNIFETVNQFLIVNNILVVATLLIFAMICAIYLIKKMQTAEKIIRLKYPFITLLILYGFWYAVCFPATYLHMDLPARTENALGYYSILIQIVAYVYIILYLHHKIVRRSTRQSLALTVFVVTLCFITALVCYGYYSQYIQTASVAPRILKTKTVIKDGRFFEYWTLVNDLKGGRVQGTAAYLDKYYYQKAQVMPRQELSVRCLSYKPITIFDDLVSDDRDWHNTSFADYYHMESVRCV